jgi:hypothetical protein
MLLDDRLLSTNSTLDSRNDWAADSWPKIELIWSFMIVLHLAALLHIDPVVIHILNLLLKQIPHAATPRIGYCEGEAFLAQL